MFTTHITHFFIKNDQIYVSNGGSSINTLAPLNVILQYNILLCIVYLLLVILIGANHLVVLFNKKRLKY
jgi:hypothetical protein